MDLTRPLQLKQERYNDYIQVLKVVDITRDPGWKRLTITNPHLAENLIELINIAKKAIVPLESMIWIRSMDEYVSQYPEILERLEKTFKPLYEAAKHFDIWA